MLLDDFSIRVRDPANKEDIVFMVSSRRQLSPCPVCGRADQVKKMQTAYEAGELHIAPPPMPEARISMMKYVGVGMILVGIGAFLVLVILASGQFSWLQMIITLAFIVMALVLSFVAVHRIGQGDEEARRRYPVWDLAMANWNRLLYCARDKVVFDPQSKKALSDTAVKTLLDMDQLEERNEQQVMVSH
jgi:NADH:ubiquinone oxidoreductase subunit 3 (subunit A)